MTLKEIAKQAGVSISTVSRVINQKNTKAASPEVQNRIWENRARERLYPEQLRARPEDGGLAVAGRQAPENGGMPVCAQRDHVDGPVLHGNCPRDRAGSV